MHPCPFCERFQKTNNFHNHLDLFIEERRVKPPSLLHLHPEELITAFRAPYLKEHIRQTPDPDRLLVLRELANLTFSWATAAVCKARTDMTQVDAAWWGNKINLLLSEYKFDSDKVRLRKRAAGVVLEAQRIIFEENASFDAIMGLNIDIREPSTIDKAQVTVSGHGGNYDVSKRTIVDGQMSLQRYMAKV